MNELNRSPFYKRRLCAVLRAAVTFALCLLVGPAAAQDGGALSGAGGAGAIAGSSANIQIAISPAEIVRADPFVRTAPNAIYYVSHADCQDATATLTFQVTPPCANAT